MSGRTSIKGTRKRVGIVSKIFSLVHRIFFYNFWLLFLLYRIQFLIQKYVMIKTTYTLNHHVPACYLYAVSEAYFPYHFHTTLSPPEPVRYPCVKLAYVSCRSVRPEVKKFDLFLFFIQRHQSEDFHPMTQRE